MIRSNPNNLSFVMATQSDEKSFAYFLGLEIENILCFKEKQTLELFNSQKKPAQWTVILGDNGVGKTTLLRCIAGMSLYEEEVAMVAFNIPLKQSSKEKNIQINTTFDDIYDSIMWECNAFRSIEGEDNFVSAEYYFDKSLSTNSLPYSEDPSKNPIGQKSLWALTDAEWSLPDKVMDSRCFGYSATRTTNPSSLSENPIDHPFANLFSDKAFLINAEEWLLQTDYAQKSSQGEKKRKLTKKITDIKQVFKDALPDIDDFDFDFGDRWDTEAYVKFKTPYGWVRFEDLGLGYKTMIVWLLDLTIRLYERYPDSEDPLSEPAIVLVDEIDLHLHPKWQRQIMSFLTERFPNTQFIVTAHSPLVVQASQDANIVLLRREGDRVVIDNNPEIVDNWRVDQILTSLFELPSARPAKLDPYIEEREAILAKSHLTNSDTQRLEKLREIIGSFPSGERPEERQAMDIIRRAATLIEEQNKHDSD